MKNMTKAHEGDGQMSGLRERKKVKTRAMIEEHALRLFVQQGYEATTVEQIAEAAEVSPSTFFRYFPAKEDIVLNNLPNAAVIELFGTQPLDLTPLQALRASVRQMRTKMTPEEYELLKSRFEVIHAVPELKSLAIKEFIRIRERFAELIASRMGRKADDFEVVVFAGAVIGVWIAVLHSVKGCSKIEEFPNKFDKALQQLESGFTLQ
jgi:AcrR family transcriptional regulator